MEETPPSAAGQVWQVSDGGRWQCWPCVASRPIVGGLSLGPCVCVMRGALNCECPAVYGWARAGEALAMVSGKLVAEAELDSKSGCVWPALLETME